VRTALLLALACCGCRQLLGFDDPMPVPQADAAELDAPDALKPPCDLSAPFGAPVPLPAPVNSSDEDFACDLSTDELTLYLTSNHLVTGVAMFQLTRTSTTAPWGPRAQIYQPAVAADQWSFSVSADGLRAVVTSDRNMTDSQLFLATRMSVGDSFPDGTPLSAVNTSASDETPRLTRDDQTLYFDTNTSTHGRDLFRASASGQDFVNPVRVDELDTDGNEAGATLTADQLTIYFGRTALASSNEYDVYVARRASKAVPFEPATIVPELSTGDIEVPGVVSPDGCRLYLSRVSTSTDVLLAEKPPAP
jgi:hypothetical protein